MEVDNRDIIRDSIADLLLDDVNLTENIDDSTLKFNKIPSTLKTYEMATLEQSRKKAKGVMESLLKIYLSDNFISKNEYVQAKVNLDSMTLGNIINQMEVSQRAISILMENIEIGDINPKLFETLGKLQSTFIDLVRAQTNYIMNAGNEYEKIAIDKDTTIEEASVSTATEISSGFKSSSQKDLMRLIRKATDKDDNK